MDLLSSLLLGLGCVIVSTFTQTQGILNFQATEVTVRAAALRGRDFCRVINSKLFCQRNMVSSRTIIYMSGEFACFIMFCRARQQVSCGEKRPVTALGSGADGVRMHTMTFYFHCCVFCVGILRQIDNCFLGWLHNPSPGASCSSSAASRLPISRMLGGRAGGAAAACFFQANGLNTCSIFRPPLLISPFFIFFFSFRARLFADRLLLHDCSKYDRAARGPR